MIATHLQTRPGDAVDGFQRLIAIGNAGECDQLAFPGARGEFLAEQIRRDLSELIRAEIRDPRVQQVSLTAVEVTPDYAHAKVYFTSMTGQDGLDDILRGLRRASGFLRRELGRRVRIHTLPELHFQYDPSVENGNRLSSLIDRALESDRQFHPEDEAAGDDTSGKGPSVD